MPATSFAVPITSALPDCLEMTLLELVQVICDETRDDREVVATVRKLSLLRSEHIPITNPMQRSWAANAGH